MCPAHCRVAPQQPAPARLRGDGGNACMYGRFLMALYMHLWLVIENACEKRLRPGGGVQK